MQAFESPRFSRSSNHPSNLRRPTAMLSVLAMSAVLAGAVSTAWLVVTPAPVFALCQGANQGCLLGDTTKTAVVDAAYFIPGGSSVTPVEPGSATTWSITAYWGLTPGGNCNDHVEAATVDVSWNGTNWVTANFNGTTNIHSAAVCTLSACGSRSSSYRMYVDVEDPTIGGNENLRQVVFAATTVPNGTDFSSTTCALGSSRTPTASSFSGTDTSTWECALNCNATGTTVNLTYN